MLGRDFLRSRIRAVLTARCPEYNEILTSEFFDAEHREVGWLNEIAELQQLALNLVDLVRGDANRREEGLPVVIAVLSNDDVSAAEVLEVVCKGA